MVKQCRRKAERRAGGKAWSVAGKIMILVYLVCATCFCSMPAVGIRPFVVLSGSMEPEMQVGSLCFIDTEADYQKTGTGDVVAFETPAGGIAAHRVKSVTGQGLETQGDANGFSDGISVTEQNYKGKVIFWIPYMGYVCKYFQTQYGLVLAGILLCAAIFYCMDDKKEKSCPRPGQQVPRKVEG